MLPLWHEALYLGGFKHQIPIPSCDFEGVAVRHPVGTDLAVGEGLQGLGLSLSIQRHGCSSYTQPQLLGKTPCRTLEGGRDKQMFQQFTVILKYTSRGQVTVKHYESSRDPTVLTI